MIILVLGMAVEALAWQLSGCLVREIDGDGAVARDSRIRPGGKIRTLAD